MDLRNTVLSMDEWTELIHRAETGEISEPLENVDHDNTSPYDVKTSADEGMEVD
ncbi:hypothetical protein [Mycolicibacterium tusciae]|uniref:hypothetical protein n=1 Tax=Mycolicibacterium tusciae TaxID=75922 RepID=UPI00024A4818|nr:hypothetical protein [Mycolicibacterium tusciae]